MNKYNLITILGIIGIVAILGILAKKEFYNPKHKPDSENYTVDKLIEKNILKEGDLIFQTSLSSQSIAIQRATKSKYSHCGLIYKRGKDYFVFEAVQPVKLTPIENWIARGKNGKFVIKRLKNSDEILTSSVLLKMKKIGEQFVGKQYDLTFEWTDEKIYCSELIWKIYQRATGIQIGKPEKLSDFDLSDKAVQQKFKERYGKTLPHQDTVISPASVFNSENLITVTEN